MSEPADSDRGFAEGTLGVDRSFAGQAQVGTGEPIRELDGGDDQVDAGLELAVRECDQAASQTAGGERMAASSPTTSSRSWTIERHHAPFTLRNMATPSGP